MKICSWFCIVGLLFSTGCATIISRSKYDVQFQSDPPGSQVRVVRQRDTQVVFTGTTPTHATLKAGNGFGKGADYVAFFDKLGYQTGTEIVNRGIDPWFMLSIITFNPIAYGIDAGTGAMWQLQPSVNVTLDPKNQ